MSTTQTIQPATAEGRAFPFFRFSGTHRQIGEQFGEACGDLIHRHLDKALTRLDQKSGINREVALARAMAYRPYVLKHASFFDDEIQGLATGAGLSLPEAYLLQLRAEVATPVTPSTSPESNDECTSFAVLAEATSNGSPLVGQNADLPAFYGEIAIVAEIVPDDMPSVLMLMPAGQVSYIGINNRGMGVFANFVTCDGWRHGLPRYMLSRLALTQSTVDDGIGAVRGVTRASSRNLMLLDSHGAAADLETTPSRDARLDPVEGLLAHSNHYVAESLQHVERSKPKNVANSKERLRRMDELLAARRGGLNAEAMQTILRDRACYPDALCRMPGDDPDSDVITFASVIAEPSLGRLWVAVGPPNEHAYQKHELSA
ncbi:MAG TPA: C45 family peptidase [Thermomicrobiales bacterium]|nr:C45 family peptidase [Thermomicrobiales bacterium]